MPDSKKTVIILIGPKGSGKTFIGTRLSELTHAVFLRVENIWLNLPQGENGWQHVEQNIDEVLTQTEIGIIESLGVSDGFNGMLKNLSDKYNIKLVKIVTNLNECLKRVRERSADDHIPVSDTDVQKYNNIAITADYDWDIIIDNNIFAEDSEILKIAELF